MKVKVKIKVLLLALCCVSVLSAQKWALEGGYVNLSRAGSLVRTTYSDGGKIGLTANFDLKQNFSLLTGGLYTLAYAYELQKDFPKTQATYTTFGHFLDVPIHVQYAIPFSKTVKMFAYAGPTLNIGLAQSQNVRSTIVDVPSGTYDLFDNSLSRFNLQASVGGGIQWKKFQIKSGYDFGLLNINRLSNGNVYQSGWYASFVYELGK